MKLPRFGPPTMRAFLSVILGVSSIPAFSQVHDFRSQDGQVLLHFGGGKIEILAGGAWKCKMVGGVQATSLRDGLDIKCDHGTAIVKTVGKDTVLQSLHAVGGVVVTKTAKDKAGVKTTTMTGSLADYKTGATESAVDLSGPVHIKEVNAAEKRVLDADGSSGRAILAGKGAANPLRTATLRGPVTVHVQQAPEKAGSKKGTLVATGNELTYDCQGKLPFLTLSGNIVMKGQQGPLGGTFHLPKVIIHLNEKHEQTGIDLPGDAN